MDYSKFSDCKLISTILFRNCCNTKITKPSHVENNTYLDYLNNNPTNIFVENKIGLNSQKPYFTIYIKPEIIKYFIYICLKDIKKPFVIVSGSSDLITPSSILNNNEMNTFLNDCRLVHWYGQNMAFSHKKITNIPIGLDYHSLLKDNSLKWHNTIIDCNSQESILIKISKEAKPFDERLLMCYSNFHFALREERTPDRRDAINGINRNIIFYEPIQTDRKTFWTNQTNYKFAVCPHGGGYDTHRLWECLILGCIVIVKTSAIDILYKDLPVIIVDNWSDVNMDLLVKESKKFTNNSTYDYKSLNAKYWIEKIYSH